jgi:hypothetical protein
MSAAVIVIMKIVAEFMDIRKAMLAGMITLVMPSVALYAQDARPYAFATLFACLSVRLWLMRTRRPGRHYTFLLALSLLAGILMHAYTATLIFVVLTGALMLWQDAAPGLLRATILASVASAVAALPFLILVDRYAKGQITAPAVGPRSMAYTVAALPAGILKPLLAPIFAGLALALGGASIVMILRSRSKQSVHERPLAVIALIWLIVPPTILTAAQIFLGKPTLEARYWEFCVPALSILVTLLVVKIGAWRTSAAFVSCALLVALALPTQVFLRGDDGHDGTQWQTFPSILAAPSLRTFPISLNGWALDALLVYDHGQYSHRLFIKQPADVSGLVYPVLRSPHWPVMLRAAQQAGGLVAYRTRTSSSSMPSSSIPTAAFFSRLVNLRAGHYVLRLSCDYFGGGLGVFGLRGQPRNLGAFAEAAREIELRSAGHAHCVLEQLNPR